MEFEMLIQWRQQDGSEISKCKLPLKVEIGDLLCRIKECFT